MSVLREATSLLSHPDLVLAGRLFIAAVVGNVVGYWIGYKAGPSLFNKPDSKLFKKEYVDHTHRFFNKYGARAIILRNEKGATLELTGKQIGLIADLDLTGLAISLR